MNNPTGAENAQVQMMNVKQRFFDKVAPEPNSGCWLWMASCTAEGYGQFWLEKTNVRAHRWIYEFSVGPIPDGLQIDHLCRVRSCVNPAHLEAVDQQTNLLRGEGLTAINARKTHCPAGHPYSGENLYNNPRGARICRTCGRQRSRIERAAKQKGAE